MGSTGILAALQDGGAQQLGFSSYFAKLQRRQLHPVQFLELTASFFYKASLLNRTPKFMIIDNRDELVVFQLPLAGFSRKPLYDDWKPETYAEILAYYTGMPMTQLYSPPTGVWTWLRNKRGRVPTITFEQCPWPPSGRRQPVTPNITLQTDR